LPEARARWTDTLGQVSDLRGQFGERVGKSSGRRSVGAEIVEPAMEVLNEGMACDDDLGRSVTFQPSHRSKPGLEASVVGLNGVVRMDLRAMEGGRHQLVEDSWVDAVAVGRNLDW
jgi:hypothetical protein